MTFLIGCMLLGSDAVFSIELKNGDLLFREPCSGSDVSSAIQRVTQSADHYNFTHVGIVYRPVNEDRIYVIEATSPTVRVVTLEEYLYPNPQKGCKPISVVGRLRAPYQPCIPDAIQEALQLVGKEYDYGYVLDNDKYYCSELIYEIFLKANGGVPVFKLNTMTFKQADSTETDINWIRYFSEKGLEIPEGKPGINPGAMSRSDVLDLLGRL